MSPNGLDHRSVIVRGDAPSETTVRSVMAWVIDSAVARSISPPPPKLFPPPPKLFPPPPKLFPPPPKLFPPPPKLFPPPPKLFPPPPKLFPPPPKLFPPPPKLFPEELARAAVAPFWAKSKLPGQLMPQSHAPKNSSLGLPS